MSTSWKRASPSNRKRASDRAKKVKVLLDVTERAVNYALRQFSNGNSRVMLGKNVVTFAFPKQHIQRANRDPRMKALNVMLRAH
jgi:hypothetical protein